MSTENTDADADLSEIPKDEYTDKIDMTEEEENQDLQQTEEDESDEYSFDKFFKRELKIASSNNSGKDKTDIQSYPVRNYAPGDTCPICLMAYEDDQFVRELPKCNHEFHKECIDEWLSEGQNTCPMCRVSKPLGPSTELSASIIGSLLPSWPVLSTPMVKLLSKLVWFEIFWS
ncbi:unnamed protein product [[Candida] boidinii]|nr:unnamed protein product [[Candida] boidinii]